MSYTPRIYLIGFGEVGQILAADLKAGGANVVSAWDPLFVDPISPPSRALFGFQIRAEINASDAARHEPLETLLDALLDTLPVARGAHGC